MTYLKIVNWFYMLSWCLCVQFLLPITFPDCSYIGVFRIFSLQSKSFHLKLFYTSAAKCLYGANRYYFAYVPEISRRNLLIFGWFPQNRKCCQAWQIHFPCRIAFVRGSETSFSRWNLTNETGFFLYDHFFVKLHGKFSI